MIKKDYKIFIKKDTSNQRIDNFLFTKFKTLPKSLIYKNLRLGKILINTKKKKPSYKLKNHDEILLKSLKITPFKKKKYYFIKI
ncbi:S4 domain-containing protein [Buchnera aphidicola]|uniref:S4 domain-containing protein n=1 Tax=Buchnera aphidicola TaxID=9 RepID=UPI0031B6CD6C